MRAATHSSRGRNNPATSSRRNNLPATDREKIERRISQLKATIIFKWISGKFCSTHSHVVGPNHDIARYNEKGQSDNHIATATRNNPVRPGATRNKGWDDWLMKS